MNKKICAWNINLATNRNTFIPEFVGEEIKYQNSEFLILTEFCKTKNHENFIRKYIVNNGYDYVLSNNIPKHNDVLLAWKKDQYQLIEDERNIITNSITPNFAYITLKDNEGFQFVLAGVRITTIDNYEDRANQLRFVMKKLKTFPKVVIGGDFNCLRRGTPELRWNIREFSRICKQYDFELVTPKGQSVFAENATNENNEFAEDHFVVKGMKIENERYDRSFADRNTNIYLHGRDFSVFDYKLYRDIWCIKFGSGIPDHAIICGDIIFQSKKDY